MNGLITILRSLGTLIASGVKRKETLGTVLLLIVVAVSAQLFNLSGAWVTSTLECLNQSLPPTSADTSTRVSPKKTINGSRDGILNSPE